MLMSGPRSALYYDHSPWLGSLSAYFVFYPGFPDDPLFMLSFNTFSYSVKRLYDSRVGKCGF